MKNQLEQYFGCKVKIAEYKNKLPLPIFMTMRDIMMVEIYGVSFMVIMMLATRGADLRPGILLMLRGWLYQSLKNLRTALRVQHRST